jgi:hypothetical protein
LNSTNNNLSQRCAANDLGLSFLIPSFLFVGAAVYLQPPDDVKNRNHIKEGTNQCG